MSGKHDHKFVRIRGSIVDVIHDDTNVKYRFLIVNSDNETLYATTQNDAIGDEALKTLVGAEVSICGLSDLFKDNACERRQFRRSLYFWELSDITVRKPAPASLFDAEELGDLTNVRPADIPRLGRRRVRGKVLATWNRSKILVRRPDGELMRLETDGPTAPSANSFIEAVGLPESDLYRVNLARVIWRPTEEFASEELPETNITAGTILTDGCGHREIKLEFYGRAITLSGIIRSLPQSEDGKFYLEDGDFLVPVDASAASDALRGLEVGCTIRATGICVMNIESWRPTAVFPRIDGFTLVPRTGDDIVVLSRPPWWTAGRLLAVIGTLIAALVGFVIWNRALQRLADRRGRKLYRSQIEKFASDLRTGERTRLAVELHDTISQNLTGISMQIGAATNFVSTNREKASKHLDIANRALDSCRDELRNCIWDLRNGALDKRDMNAAIRNALSPYVGDTHLAIRFSVPRSDLSEKTAHTIICIVRELAANAVRHGQAQSVRVAGATEGLTLSISVTDNGQGFDPDSRPGVSEGHYGLQGIRERLKDYTGTLSLESTPGRGTKAVVTLTLPHEERKI